MIHVTLTFKYRNVPIEITIDAAASDVLDLSPLGSIIDKAKAAVNVMLDGKPHV